MAFLLLWRLFPDKFPFRLLSYYKIQNFSRSWMDHTISNIEAFSACCSFIKPTTDIKPKCGDYQLFSTAMSSNWSNARMFVEQDPSDKLNSYLLALWPQIYGFGLFLQLPNFKRTAPQIPQVWSPEEIDKILAVIDTANPVGRRNYAIFLLLARTGLRISDVLGLKFSNINWKENCISLSAEDRNALSLPLSKELGMADYFLFARWLPTVLLGFLSFWAITHRFSHCGSITLPIRIS